MCFLLPRNHVDRKCRHCPSGIPEPTTPPPAEAAEATASSTPTEVSASTTTTSEAAKTACEPHGDHWHCPSEIAEPTTSPAATATGEDHDHENHDQDEHDHEDHDHEVTATTCEPHGGHWHCPSGVAEPTTPPAVSITTSPSTSVTITGSAAPVSSQFDGAAAVVGPMGSLPLAAAGILGIVLA